MSRDVEFVCKIYITPESIQIFNLTYTIKKVINSFCLVNHRDRGYKNYKDLRIILGN